MGHVRVAVMTALLLAFVGALVWLGRATASEPLAPTGLFSAFLGAPIAIVCIGSFYQWLRLRCVYHGPRFRPIYEIHQRGHHWHRFPPDHYVEAGPVDASPSTRPPLWRYVAANLVACLPGPANTLSTCWWVCRWPSCRPGCSSTRGMIIQFRDSARTENYRAAV
jgi:hypothetical protein